MSFTGKLQEISFADVLQSLSLTEKTGRLTLVRREGHGVVILRKGRIVYAATSSVREAFGNILVCQGLVDEATLMAALEIQHSGQDDKRLGTILVEMGAVTREDLERVMRRQTGGVIRELLSWKTGFFKFERFTLPERGEIEVDARELVVSGGLSACQLLLDAEGDDEAERATGTLAEAVAEVAPAAFLGEATSRIMSSASEVLRRGLLFVIRDAEAVLMGRFGLPAGAPDLVLSLEEPSIISDVVDRQEPYVGPLFPGPGDDALLGSGGVRPQEVVALPLVLGGRVAMVLYGDNLPVGDRVAPIEGLLATVQRAAVDIEAACLERRRRRLDAPDPEGARRDALVGSTVSW